MQENKQEKSPIKTRIMQYINFKDITKYSLYRDTGISRGILDQDNGISEENLRKFLDYAQDISPIWLLTGEGDMLKTAGDQTIIGDGINIGHGNTIHNKGDIANGKSNINKNTINVTLPKSGTQKIIRPDGTVEVIANAHPGKVSAEKFEGEISELRQKVAQLERSLDEKDSFIKHLSEMIVTIKSK